MRRTYLAAVVAGVCAMAFPAGALANTGEHKTAQHNVAAQGNAQGLQANVAPQAQVLSGDNGNGLIASHSGNGNSNSQTSANQDQSNAAVQSNSASDRSADPSSGASQSNGAAQGNIQGLQLNIAPQAQVLSGDNGNGLIASHSGNGNSNSQTSANQDQSNAAVQSNSASGGSSKGGCDSQRPSGAAQQSNGASQGNAQGLQLNVAPQAQVLSGDNGNGLIASHSGNGNSNSQTSANQDQGNLLLQGNGS